MGLKFCPDCETDLDESEFTVNQGRLYTYCRSCTNKRQNKRNRLNMQAWAAILGDNCVRCGYGKCLAALDFHHRDPSDKLFAVSRKLYAVKPSTCKRTTYEQILMEAEKCDLLCANCHREVHYKEKHNGS